MSDMRTSPLIKRIGMDIMAWFCMPTVFLFLYVHHHGIASTAIRPHLYLALIGLLSLVLLRFLLCRALANLRLAHVITAYIISTVMIILLLYYGLVLIGLGAWGRVISWDLITSYMGQFPGLMESLGISMYLAGALGMVSYAVLWYATHAYVKQFDWIALLTSEMSKRRYWGLVAAGLIFCTLSIYHFILSPSVRAAEPLSLTFFPLAAARELQGHFVDQLLAEKLDRLDDDARSSYRPVNEAKKRNLILIVVDALRPDRMGVYGHHRHTTPRIERLVQSQGGYVVRNVRASCGDSTCGLLSLASSKFSHQFSNRPFTLQQALRYQGYRVEMILSGDHTNFYGLKDLYGSVDSYFDGSMAGAGHYINDDQIVLERIQRTPAFDGNPVMMQFHLMSAHLLGKRYERHAMYKPATNYALPGHRAGRNYEEFGNFYDNGVIQTDTVILHLLEQLKIKGYLSNALVVITADHGESLGEHGHFGHANSVREEALRIPLILIPFGYQSDFHPKQRAVSQVDIAPTILEELGFSVPATWSGIAIQSHQRSDYSYFQEGKAAGLIDHRDPTSLWKYWVDAESGNEYVFNLSQDPTEKNNMAALAPIHLIRGWRLQQMQVMPGVPGRKRDIAVGSALE